MNNRENDSFKNIQASAELKKAMGEGDLEKALASLDEKTAAKVKAVIADREAAEKLLSSPQAQRLMKMFMKEKE